jgi:predicted glycosyltransferase
MATRVMFYCQHVLGMGHLVRSAEIASPVGELMRLMVYSHDIDP